MGIGAILGGIGSLVSLGSAVGGLGGGGGPGGSYGGVPLGYQLGNQPEADVTWTQLMRQLTQGAGQQQNLAGQYAPFAQSIINNPYQSLMQSGANAAAAYGGGTLPGMMAQGASSLQGLGNLAAGSAPQLMSTAFDPQQALYNRTQQQVQDQSNAVNAMYGLSSSPYGAGLTQQALSNFNIDWQNQQLGRQLQGAQGLGTLAQTAGKGFAGAGDLGTAAAGNIGQFSALPYQTANVGPQNAISALNAQGAGQQNAFGLSLQDMNQLLAYLGQGNLNTGTAQAGQNQGFLQQQILGQQFGQALNQLGGLFSNQSGSSGGGFGSLFGGSSAMDPFSAQSTGYGYY